MSRARAIQGACAAAVVLAAVALTVRWSMKPSPNRARRIPDVGYVPTPIDVVDQMLELARVGKDDLVYDLGCGDGRILVRAATRHGAHGFGIDLDPIRVAEARANVASHHLERSVRIEEGDLFDTDLSRATVVTLFLTPELNLRLLPRLAQLPAGARVVSYTWDIRGVAPQRDVWFIPGRGLVDAATAGPKSALPVPHSRLFLWTAPLDTQ